MDDFLPVRPMRTRRCGRRKTGGLYLVADPDALGSCGKLPIALERCPTCRHGFALSRTPYMIPEPEALWADKPCRTPSLCKTCPLADGRKIGPALLLRVGEAFYPNPDTFIKEALQLGVSRRVQHIPAGFQIGETWVLLGHIKAVYPPVALGQKPQYLPGIFGVVRPSRIEVPVDLETITEAELAAYRARGITPVVDMYAEDIHTPALPALIEEVR